MIALQCFLLIIVFPWSAIANTLIGPGSACAVATLPLIATPGAELHENQNFGVSLYYTPALQINGVNKMFDNHVFIETFNPGGRTPRNQALVQFLDPVHQILARFGQYDFHKIGLDAVIKSLGPLVDPVILRASLQAEKSSPLQRQSTFLIRHQTEMIAKGFIRIFDGTGNAGGIKNATNRQTPDERMLISLGKKTDIVDKRREEGFAVFNVGRYFIDPNLPLAERKIIKGDILNWLIDFIESRGDHDNSYYFTFASDRAHRLLHQREFGLHEVPAEFSTGLVNGEAIMEITGTELLANLKASLKTLSENP